jgi:hypothetical protein
MGAVEHILATRMVEIYPASTLTEAGHPFGVRGKWTLAPRWAQCVKF